MTNPELLRKPLENGQAQLFITESCNLSCDGCPYPHYPAEKRKMLHDQEIHPAEWKNITDFLYHEGNRLFCVIGGEPASYRGVDQVIANISQYQDAFVLLSTSGIHLLHNPELRQSVGKALSQPENRENKNGIAISFDSIPVSGRGKKGNSRSIKAKQGLEFVKLMQEEFPGQMIYIANVMVNQDNLSEVLDIQSFLEDSGIYTNLCTQQGKCFGAEAAVFDDSHIPQLYSVGSEMIARKIQGGLVANSAFFLSQLPGIIGMEDYRCWEEEAGNPVIDVGPDGIFRFCSWITQEDNDAPPGIDFQRLRDGIVSWDEFWSQSRKTTRMLCKGCSWSRRDRNVIPMVEYNPDINNNTLSSSPEDVHLQNIWVQAQRSISY